jgi:hypothetical protein
MDRGVVPPRSGHRGAARLLRRHGAAMAAKPESFLVTNHNRLRAGEEDRACAWGRQLAGHPAGQLRIT